MTKNVQVLDNASLEEVVGGVILNSQLDLYTSCQDGGSFVMPITSNIVKPQLADDCSIKNKSTLNRFVP